MSRKKNYDLNYKVLVVGESTVGKTSIIQRLQHPEQQLPTPLMPTIGIDFVNIYEQVDNVKIRLQIWDTAGQERFQSFTKLHFRGTKGLVLVFDVTNTESFHKLIRWLKDIESHGLAREQLIIVGNKIDLENERQVSKKRAKKLAYEFGHEYYETSAKNNINIQEVFKELATSLKVANNPYYVPVLADPKFELEVDKVNVVERFDQALTVVDEQDGILTESKSEQQYYCCSS